MLLLGSGCRRIADQQQEDARLGYDHDSAQVGKVQLILMYSGIDVGYLDAVLGPETRDALRRFQKERGLPATGYLGDATWAALMEIESREGPFSISAVQERLTRAGLDPGPVDGRIGHKTRAALAAFQRTRSIAASGRVDPPTWAALARLAEPSAAAP